LIGQFGSAHNTHKISHLNAVDAHRNFNKPYYSFPQGHGLSWVMDHVVFGLLFFDTFGVFLLGRSLTMGARSRSFNSWLFLRTFFRPFASHRVFCFQCHDLLEF